jgi:hypothetical protein
MKTQKKLGGGLFLIFLAFGGWFLHQNAQAQALPKGMKLPPSREIWNVFAPPVVNLPAGQKFVAFVPPYQSEAMSTDWSDAYITRERDADEKPHRYAYTKPGRTFGSWEVKFYIQEH